MNSALGWLEKANKIRKGEEGWIAAEFTRLELQACVFRLRA